jgi:hypothetical protein
MKIQHHRALTFPEVAEQLAALWNAIEALQGATPIPHSNAEATRQKIKQAKADRRVRK